MSYAEDPTFIHPLTYRRVYGYFHTDQTLYTVDQRANNIMQERIRSSARYNRTTNRLRPCDCIHRPRKKRCNPDDCPNAGAKFECLHSCAARDTVHPCINRGVTDEKWRPNLVRVKVSTKTHLGMYLETTQSVKKDEIIGEVCGVLRIGNNVPNEYCFPFDDPFRDEDAQDMEMLYLDLSETGNEYRYLNTECYPNAKLVTKIVGTQFRMVVKATAAIKANTEITVDYPKAMMRFIPFHGCGDNFCRVYAYMYQTRGRRAAARPLQLLPGDVFEDDDDSDYDPAEDNRRGRRGGRGRGRRLGGGRGQGQGRGGRGRGRGANDNEEGGRGRGRAGRARGNGGAPPAPRAPGRNTRNSRGNRGGTAGQHDGGAGGVVLEEGLLEEGLLEEGLLEEGPFEEGQFDDIEEGQVQGEVPQDVQGEEEPQPQAAPEPVFLPNVFREDLIGNGMSRRFFEFNGLGPVVINQSSLTRLRPRYNPISAERLQQLEDAFAAAENPEVIPDEDDEDQNEDQQAPPPAGEGEGDPEDENINIVLNVNPRENIREDQPEQ